MSSAAAVVVGALISGVVGVLVVFYQQGLARSHEVDKARAARLSEFPAAGWSATLAISDLARTPVDGKEAVEASDRFQALSDRFNAALAQIQLLDDGEVYAAAHRVNAYLTALNREARSAHFDHAAVRGGHAELAAHVAAYQRAARKALGSTDLPGPLPWLPAPAETYVAGKANDDATSELPYSSMGASRGSAVARDGPGAGSAAGRPPAIPSLLLPYISRCTLVRLTRPDGPSVAHHCGMRVGGWWTGLSPRRRVLVGVLVLVVAAAAAVAGVRLSRGQPKPVAGRPGAVLLVPGYGGGTTSLDELAARIRRAGWTATVVRLAGNGTGDLTVQAQVLAGYVNRAIGAGSGPVTVIGYSAGGVVAWLWDVDYGGAAQAGMIITLGSPLHGARIAAVGAGFDPAECSVACQQLVPGSALLSGLQRSAQSRPPWLSLWSTDDQTVQPPDSARLPGAVNVPLQSVCPGANIQHSQLPDNPLVDGIVLRTLKAGRVSAPAPGDCAVLQAAGTG